MMKKNSWFVCLLIVIGIVAAFTHHGWSRSPFKFPDRIQFKFLKKGRFMGQCNLRYKENVGRKEFGRQLSSIMLDDFGGLGFTSPVRLSTFFFQDDFSFYLDSVQEGRNVISQIKLEKGISGLDAQEGLFLIYRGKETQDKGEQEIFTRYRIISFLSSFFIASQRVADGGHKKNEHFNFVVDKSTKVVEMRYGGQEQVPFAGKYVITEVVLLTNPNNNNVEVLRMRIYKDKDGYYFPVSILFSEGDSFELRADDVRKSTSSIPLQNHKLYAAHLPYMDAKTESISTKTGFMQPLLDEIEGEIKNLEITNSQEVVINGENNRIPNANEAVRRLMAIVFDEYKPPDTKIKQIIAEYMIPYDIDIIITGQYVNDPGSPFVTFRPIVIFKSPQEVVTKNLLFKRDTLVCLETQNYKKVLCPEAQQKLEEFFVLLPGKKQKKSITFKPIPQPSKTVPPTPPVSTPPQPMGNPMTVEDVYRAIIKNKFLCYFRDDPHHQEVMKKLRKSKAVGRAALTIEVKDNRVIQYLNSRWRTNVKILINDRIKTISTKKHGTRSTIVLYWTLTMVDGKPYNYNKAEKLVHKLNLQNHKGYSDWRIPDIREIFLILNHEFKSGNFFPFNSGTGKLTTTLKIWTSNPVEENEKRIHGGCTGTNDAYFIINNVHDKYNRRIGFEIACTGEKANLLLVRSDKSPYYKTTISTSPSTAAAPPITSHMTYQRIYRLDDSLTLANLHFIDFTLQSSMASTDMGDLIDEAVFNGIKRAEQLTTYPSDNKTINSVENVNKIAATLLDPNLTKNERVNRIINGIMVPNHVDIIVTGLYIRSIHNSIITLRPMVIVKSHQKFLSTNLEFRMHELVCDSPHKNKKILCKEAYDKIVLAIKELLEQV